MGESVGEKTDARNTIPVSAVKSQEKLEMPTETDLSRQ